MEGDTWMFTGLLLLQLQQPEHAHTFTGGYLQILTDVSSVGTELPELGLQQQQ
jgi:hypothetical protein